jgi:hypothetical protein
MSDLVFTVKFEKGLADRNRLPLEQVIKALQEIRRMIIEAGREIQRERGIERPESDFGLELLGDKTGIAFHKGSLSASVAITRDASIGALAASRVLSAVHMLKGAAPKGPPVVYSKAEARILNRLDKITFINEVSGSVANLQMHGPRSMFMEQPEPIRKSAVFDHRVVEHLRALRAPVFVERGVAVYGKLFELRDESQLEGPAGRFWGELRRANGERWRVQFTAEDQDNVMKLFRRQIFAQGTAHYFQTRTPKLTDVVIQADIDRDYEAAFSEVFGCERNAFNLPLPDLLNMRYT